MNNKGFTLIELLAVIVILAIIALIATPIILNIINDARKGARERSAEYVYEAVQLAYQTKVALSNGEYPSLSDVETQISENGLSNASISGDVITTKDKVECTLSAPNGAIEISCEFDGSPIWADADDAPELGIMTVE